jgi:hypothetical protein
MSRFDVQILLLLGVLQVLAGHETLLGEAGR